MSGHCSAGQAPVCVVGEEEGEEEAVGGAVELGASLRRTSRSGKAKEGVSYSAQASRADSEPPSSAVV